MKKTLAFSFLSILFVCTFSACAQSVRSGLLDKNNLVVTNELDPVAGAALTLHAASTNLHLNADRRLKIDTSINAQTGTNIAEGLVAPVRQSLASAALTLTNEAAYRRAGDAASTNYTDATAAQLRTALSDHESPTNAQHLTNAQRLKIDAAINAQAITDVVASASAPITNRLKSVESLTNRINTALQSESDTLASVAARGDFNGSETISPFRINSQRFGAGAGEGVSGTDWTALGVSAAEDAAGDYWTAIGRGAGVEVIGNVWSALGNYAGYSAKGDYWTAVGFESGYWAKWTNSAAFGHYAGYTATGKDRLYIDVYATEPYEDHETEVHSATNDMIFGDNGQLNLGRVGKYTNAAPNRLRGRWTLNGFQIIDSASLSSNKELHADSFTNLIWKTVWSNGWCWAIAYTNTP